jgi:hypothetical protein
VRSFSDNSQTADISSTPAQPPSTRSADRCGVVRATEALAEAAFERRSYDNISVVIVVLRKYRQALTTVHY